MRASAAGVVVAFCTSEAVALPIIRPPTPAGAGVHRPAAGGRNGGRRNRKPKTADPLEAAVKDLKQAEKDLDDRSAAGRLTRSAETIVSNQHQAARQARDRAAESGTATKEQRDHFRSRASALDAILKDIRTAERNITARKTDEAKAAIQAAITGLEALTGGHKKK